MMWRRNIHSLLTLAAEPSEPDVGVAVQPQGWPRQSGLGGGGPEMEKHSRGLYTLHLQEGKGCWHGPCLHFVAEKESSALCWSLKRHFQESSRPTQGTQTQFSSHAQSHKSILLNDRLSLSFQHWSCIVFLEKELSFSYVCSVPVSQLKCKPFVGHHAFVLVHDNTEQGGRRR